MGDEHSGASPQFIYGRREDALEVWKQRNPAQPHRRFKLAAQEIIECDEWLAAWFLADAGQVRFELAEYEERATWGE